MSKESDVQSTPQWLFDELNQRYHFTLDAAADAANHKCPRWYGPGGLAEDALSVEWGAEERIWLNPPYSRGNQRRFVEKAIDHAMRGGLTIALLPADTSTQLFHSLLWKRYHCDFLPKRIRFNGVKNGAKFGSMVVTFSLRSL
jgi:phage N-6-adenine-methyltransferase